jgi:hypothetical protein
VTISIDISQTNSTKTLRVFDTSYHTDDIENFLLECLPPNKTNWITYQVSPHFNFTFNTANLHLAKAGNETELLDLPDGIYEFKISYKPNYPTLVSYYHFRNLFQVKKLQTEICKLYSGKCNFTKSEFETRKKQLLEIKFLLDAAKYSVEECLEKKQGKELYEEAKKLLTKYSDSCGC